MSNLSVNAIRFLGIDAINKANSGHPGVVMGAAPMAYSSLQNNFISIQLNQTGLTATALFFQQVMVQCSFMLFFTFLVLKMSAWMRLRVSVNGVKNTRSPRICHTAGIDATTGPLGKDFNCYWFCPSRRFLAAKYNREGYNIFDHYTYVICGDGDLMEGVSSEAASYAGLQNLISWLFFMIQMISTWMVRQRIPLQKVFVTVTMLRLHTALVENGTDLEAIHAAIETAKASGKPSLIEVKTVIGYGSPNKQGTNAVHGAPLGADETASTRQALGWDYEPFEIPEQVYADFKEHVADRGASAYQAWTKLVADYKEAHPELAAEVEAIIDGRDPVEVTPADFPALENGFSQATRNSSQDALNVVAAKLPTFLGGSADLAHSNMTYIKTDGLQDDANRLNRNIQFGVREFAMGTILNGMALHGGLRVYGGTFFVFSDYVKAAVRLSALQGLPVTYVFTHDSIAVGEDGPTHEPVEHLAGLRAMPNLNVFRPSRCAWNEAAWYLAVTSEKTPTALVLTRQNLTVEDGTDFDKVAKGAYVVYEMQRPTLIPSLIATGSEVNLAVSAAKELASQGEKSRVVSMPSTDVFDKQDAAYKEEILPNAVRRRVAVEMGASQNWYKYVGLDGAVLGIDTFGASAPAPKVLAEYGFTVENLVKIVRNLK
nr:recP peptide [Streptococcus pneumoniae]